MDTNGTKTNGWSESAHAWIEVIGEHGDWGRQYVLDAPMLRRIDGRGFGTCLDLGCGEGRFCRLLEARGIATTGIDPTVPLIERARQLHPDGRYLVADAEALPLDAGAFDLVVSYLSLVDIPDLTAAIREVHRVLRPGGTFLIANLQSFNTASIADGWTIEADGTRRFCIDHYLQERPVWSAWRGIRIRNWHRPLGTYLSTLLGTGFVLRHFEEPAPSGVQSDKAERFRRVPNFLVMEWQKVTPTG